MPSKMFYIIIAEQFIWLNSNKFLKIYFYDPIFQESKEHLLSIYIYSLLGIQQYRRMQLYPQEACSP